MKGVVEKIDGKNITISGKTKIFNRKKYTFKIGDYVEYSEKTGSRSNEYKNIIIEKEIKTKINLFNTELKSKESNIKKPEKIDLKEKNNSEIKEVYLPYISFKNRIQLENLNKQTNELFNKYIKPISLGKVTNSQLSILENEAIRHEFNFDKLGEFVKFVESKIDKKRNVEFYESFKNDFLDKIDDKRDKDKNKKLFYLLKKYYRYSNAKKSLIELKNNEGDR